MSKDLLGMMKEIEQISPAAGRKASELVNALTRSADEEIKTAVARAEEQRNEAWEKLDNIYNIFTSYFAGTEYARDAKADDLEVKMGQVFEAFRAQDQLLAEGPPLSIDVRQLHAIVRAQQDELEAMSGTANERGAALDESLRERLKMARKLERMQIALKQSLGQTAEAKGRLNAMVLMVTEPDLPSPAKYDFAWSEGLDVVRRERAESENRLDGWRREEEHRKSLEGTIAELKEKLGVLMGAHEPYNGLMKVAQDDNPE